MAKVMMTAASGQKVEVDCPTMDEDGRCHMESMTDGSFPFCCAMNVGCAFTHTLTYQNEETTEE